MVLPAVLVALVLVLLTFLRSEQRLNQEAPRETGIWLGLSGEDVLVCDILIMLLVCLKSYLS